MKKIFCTVLAAVLMLSVFTACSQKPENQPSAESGSTVNFGLQFTYDAAYADYNGSVVSAFESLCDAVVNFESNVRMNMYLYDNVMRLFYTSFPLNVLVKDIKVSEDNSGVELTYLYDKEIHTNAVNEFSAKVLQMKEECLQDSDSKEAYIIKAYHYVASHINISDDATIMLYDTVMKGEGSSYSYSSLFEYLLLQNGIPAYHVIADGENGGGWGVAQFEMGGFLYFADVMSEYYANGGEQLTCFGMTTQEIAKDALSKPQYTDQTGAKEATDVTFDFCRACTAWEIKDNKLLVTNNDGIVIKYAL